MGYKFSCHKICFQLQLRVTITCHSLGRISPAFTFGEAGLWGSSALLCLLSLHVSQMLSQGTAAWVNIWRRGCERRERELGICMYPYSWNWFLESKLEIGSDFLRSLDKKRGASLFASSLLTSQFKSIAWVSSQSVHQEEMVIVVSVPPWESMQVTVVFALQMSFDSFKSSLWKRVHSLFLCLFPPWNPAVTLASCPSFASGFFLLCEDTSTLFTSLPSPVHRGSLAGIHFFWCSYIPEEMQPMFHLSFSWGLLGLGFFCCCCLSLHHFIFHRGCLFWS